MTQRKLNQIESTPRPRRHRTRANKSGALESSVTRLSFCHPFKDCCASRWRLGTTTDLTQSSAQIGKRLWTGFELLCSRKVNGVTHTSVTHVAESAATCKRAVGVAPEVQAVIMESSTQTEVNVKEVFQVKQSQREQHTCNVTVSGLTR